MALRKIEQQRFTVDDYLAIERFSEERHEYLDGYIFGMAGESGEHGDFCTNISGSLFVQLRGKPCRTRSKDTKVRSGPTPKHPRSMSGLYS
jgi:Uma2 family endonuclease